MDTNYIVAVSVIFEIKKLINGKRFSNNYILINYLYIGNGFFSMSNRYKVNLKVPICMLMINNN